MAGFGDDFASEVDPAAEFLAREHDELAGLEDEVKPGTILIPPSNAAEDDPTNSPGSFEMVEAVDNDLVENLKQEDDYLVDYESNPFEAKSDYSANKFEADEYNRASPSPPPKSREEPEKIKIWREEQVKRLEAKDKEEEVKKLELREIAKKELEDWYKNHEETIAKTKAANRNAEKQFVSEENELVPGTEWERIAKLCDFNPKAKQGSKDVSRMRSLVLQMKQSPVSIKPKA